MGIAHARDCRRAVVAEHDAYGIVRRQRLAANPAPGGVMPTRSSRKRALRATRKRSSLPSITRKFFDSFSNEPVGEKGLSIQPQAVCSIDPICFPREPVASPVCFLAVCVERAARVETCDEILIQFENSIASRRASSPALWQGLFVSHVL